MMFFVFDIYDIDKQCYMIPEERMGLVESMKIGTGIKHIPVLGKIQFFKAYRTVEDALKAVEVRSVLNMEVPCEGKVFKAMHEHNNSVLSFKVINNQYLLKYEG